MATKATEIYFCEKCNYSTNKKYDLNKHFFTKKHLATNLSQDKELKCLICNKIYLHRSGLWRHKKTCKPTECIESSSQQQIQLESINLLDCNVIKELLKQNNNFKELLEKQLDLLENISSKNK